MNLATKILLFARRFWPEQLFRMGQIGWHWQFDNPNVLYRRRNRLTYTRDFSNAAWTKTNGAITPDATTAPDGTLTADLFVESGATGTHRVAWASSLTDPAGQLVTYFIWLKAAGRQFARLSSNFSDRAQDSVSVDLSTGVASVPVGSVVSYSVTDAGSGWWKVVATQTKASAVNKTLWVDLATGSGAADNSYTGDGVSGIYLWGAQLELGSTATEYQDVPTTWAQAYLDAVGAERIYAWADSAGTTPNTAVGEGIGLLLGREYGGALGARVLSFDGSSTSGWVPTGATVSTAGGELVLTSTGAGTFQANFQLAGLTVGRLYLFTAVMRKGTATNAANIGFNGVGSVAYAGTSSRTCTARLVASTTTINVQFYANAAAGAGETIYLDSLTIDEIPGTHLTQATGTARPTLSARVNLLLSTTTMSTQNVTTVATSYKLSFTGTGTVTLSGTSTAGPLSAGTHNVTPTAGTLTLTVSGSVTLADLRTADDAAKNIPAYQRVGATASDHDTDGYPHFALADGTDDCWASVGTVDGSATDKLTVVAAVTKLSDAGAGIVLEHTASVAANNGSFLLLGSGIYGGGDRLTYAAETRGTTVSTYRELRPFSAPHTGVVSFAMDNGGASPSAQLTGAVNGVVPSTNVGTGTSAGNFANATLYVLSRAGTSSRFNGRFYGSTGRFGPMSDSERNNLTRWWQKRIGTA